jgi:hypothetical protein
MKEVYYSHLWSSPDQLVPFLIRLLFAKFIATHNPTPDYLFSHVHISLLVRTKRIEFLEAWELR